ncbi:MAG: RNA-binding S4 domain-containing protein [Fusobacteriaceae bacterium]|nr:RNA-binding S4 domain-containing protein [Fusobacteriaceae bacterium]
MRLDKFLKVSRIIKRRPVAKLVCDNKKIKINGKVVKSSAEVKVADILEIEYFNRYIKAKVIVVPEGNVGKAEASDLIEIMETKKIQINDEDLVREDSLEDL